MPDFNVTIAQAMGIYVKKVEHSPSGRSFTVAHFESVPLVASQRIVGTVDRTAIARENDDRIVVEILILQRLHDAPDAAVQDVNHRCKRRAVISGFCLPEVARISTSDISLNTSGKSCLRSAGLP